MVGKRPTSVVVDGFELNGVDGFGAEYRAGTTSTTGAALYSSPTPATEAVRAPSGTAAYLAVVDGRECPNNSCTARKSRVAPYACVAKR